ncbi:lipopolysaccharide biosynthesis protein [Salinimicrobium oceani]|uniref:Lipopolysaccharide biosynthesis protein n=1 Tax=Salinimicrobium oceani TaxID=2722702 RepID=A0ABX1CYW1_9FLAO|nr:lipopolysaccharide biosynthesis protein [Salinimicrobium oceani]NJW53450.1 lipopolysaccharide biosynthesis protein [Salinimicrobium oceani]
MSLRKLATKGLVWTFAQQFGNQFIAFIVSLVLARILLPAEFGLIGMISIFIAIGNTLLNAGMTQSLIRTEKPDQEDFSTVFYFNLGASIILYFLLYLSAPLISNFYDREVLTSIIRVYSLTFIISAFSAVQLARLTKIMDFKTQTLIAIPSTIIGGILGVSLAYSGFGVWSLVWSSLATATISSVQIWIYSKWLPDLSFNIQKFKEHFHFGYKLTLSGLLNKIFDNSYLLIIGKFFSPAQVGYYTRAETMKQLPVTNISNTLNKVTYPLFASIQGDDMRLKRVYSQLMQMVVFVIAPILIFIAVLAEPVFRFLFTEKWLPAVPYFQILCFTGILYPVHAYNLNILKVKGRSDLFLQLEVIKKIIIAITIAIALQFGILVLLYGQVLTSVLAFFINTHYTGKFLNYSGWEQTKDILPILLLTAVTATIILVLDYYFLEKYLDIIRILAGGTTGVLLYLMASYFLKFESLNEITKLLKK